MRTCHVEVDELPTSRIISDFQACPLFLCIDWALLPLECCQLLWYAPQGPASMATVYRVHPDALHTHIWLCSAAWFVKPGQVEEL